MPREWLHLQKPLMKSCLNAISPCVDVALVVVHEQPPHTLSLPDTHHLIEFSFTEASVHRRKREISRS